MAQIFSEQAAPTLDWNGLVPHSGMQGNEYVFQMSGMKDRQLKAELLQAIRKLHGQYLGGSVYKEEVTHLIVPKPLSSEKFLAACAGGKWILSPQYVLDCVKHQTWLPESSYELNLSAKVKTSITMKPIQTWREKVSQGITSGAFQNWVVYLEMPDPVRRNIFKRILKAGKAVVYTDEIPTTRVLTHVLTQDTSKHSHNLRTLGYNVSYIAEHLFGPVCSDSNWFIQLHKSSHQESSTQQEVIESSPITIDDECLDIVENSLLAELEEKLKDYLAKMKLQKRGLLKVPGILSCYTPDTPPQVTGVDFSNIWSLVECGLFPQALEEVQGCLKPGLLPPAPVLHLCLQYALQGEAKPYHYSMFIVVLNDILRNNPTLYSPTSAKYFLQILQCPDCKKGAWSFLQMSVRFCLASTTCHPLPSSAPVELLHFHSNLQAFMLRLFQLELHTANSGQRAGGVRGSVLYTMFWSVWEKTTLNSRALEQLTELLLETTIWALHSPEEWKLRVLATLQEILAVVVEFWAQEHTQINSRLVQEGFKDLAEYIAILSQDVQPEILRELVSALPSHRLRMFTADAIYRNICLRNGLLINSEPLNLHKTVSSYLKALGQLCGCNHFGVASRQAERTFTSSDIHMSDTEEGSCVKNSSSGKDKMPKGFNRINPAGETLLHRACKRNQLEIVLQILSVPGVDANVKDHAGWTPLHEACNHGSAECVKALLQHCPDLQLNSQVEGVSPLHDALLNQHSRIAKMLLSHAGSVLLQVRDSSGLTPLDLVHSFALREELKHCAKEGDSALAIKISKVRDLQFIETCSCLLSCLLLAYLLEHHVPSYESTEPELQLSSATAQALLSVNPETLNSQWGDAEAVALAQDLRTLMSMEQYLVQLNPALMHCHGMHTSLFIQLLNDLQADGMALLTGDSHL